jgi:hypothetical protein
MPTRISDNGFFSDQAQSITAGIVTEYKQLFFYLAEVNEHAHKYLAKLEVDSQDLKELIAAFARSSTYSLSILDPSGRARFRFRSQGHLPQHLGSQI